MDYIFGAIPVQYVSKSFQRTDGEPLITLRLTRSMYLVIIAWLYVSVLMAVAEATSSTGSVLGAIITFFFYGLVPIGILIYITGTPLRKKARLAEESLTVTPDQSSHTTSAAESPSITPVGKEPH